MLLTAAIVGATWYALTEGTWCPYTLYGGLETPLVCGFVFGLVLGDMETAMILGASIQAIYLGTVAPGGAYPSDYCAAACVGIPIAMVGGLDVSAAVALAVPVGLFGTILINIKFIITGFLVEPAERAADRCDTGAIWRLGFLWPWLIRFLISWPVIFAAIYFGADVVMGVLDAIPAWVTNGLSVAGGMLPAMGFALTLVIIGQVKYIPLFIIGFFMVQYGGLSVIACAIFAICIALFVTFFQISITDEVKGDDFDDDFDDEEEEASDNARILTNGDVNAFFLRWYLYSEVPHSFARMQALGLAAAMAPALKKMYPNEEDKDKLSAALHRELMYFNTEAIWGSAALGVVLAMEEEQAITQAMTEEEATASINGLKVGFMGPFAGVGDTIDWATLFYLLVGLGMPACYAGNPMGILPIAIGFPVITIAEGLFFTNLGYRLGRTALGQLFTSGMIEKLISATCMVGMMMMGALGSSYVSVVLANEAAQATLDSIVPGLLPLITIFVIYLILMFKTQKVAVLSFGIIGVGLLLSLLGIM